MGVRLITSPAIEPVTLAEAKADLRIDHDDDNALLGRHIAEAREWVEKLLQIKLLFQTWELVIDKFPPSEIKLPFGPVNSIVSILYDDAVERCGPTPRAGNNPCINIDVVQRIGSGSHGLL